MGVHAAPAFWWRAGLVAAGLAGFLSGSHRLTYYTSQSNIIVVGYFLGVLYWMVRRGTTAPAAPRLRGAVTLWITITAVVSHLVLNHGDNPLPGLIGDDAAATQANRSAFLLHYVVPGMVLVDWVAFGPRRVARWRDLPLWLSFPYAYALLSVGRALAFPAVPDRYPYPFLDPTEQGYGGVAAGLTVLAVEIAALGALLIALDRVLPWGRRRAAGPAGGTAPTDSPAAGDAVPALSREGA